MKKVLRNITDLVTLRTPLLRMVNIYKAPKDDIIRIGFCHHKCGTVYLRKVFGRLAGVTGLRFMVGRGDYQSALDSGSFLFFPNATYRKNLAALAGKEYRGFHIVRDPRDIIVSGYFSHKNSHNTSNQWGEKYLTAYREALNQMSKEEGLLKEIQDGHALRKIKRWNFDDPNILEIKFEDMVADPLKTFTRVTKFLRMNLSKERLMAAIEANSFENLSKGRKPGEEDKNSHFRKGTPGDWKNHFTEEHVKLFKEKWGDLLIKTGYEKNNEWAL